MCYAPRLVKALGPLWPYLLRSRRLDLIAALALFLALFVSVMAVGAVHPIPLGVTFVIVAASSGIVVARRGLGDEASLVYILLALAAYTAFQAVPLPDAWVAKLAPANHAVWTEALRPWRLAGPTRHALSLDPHATWIETYRWLTYAGVAILAANVARTYGQRLVLGIVFVVAALVALTTFAHGAFGVRSLFGVYSPRYATPNWVSPLLNQNNLAGYLNLGLFCGVGLLARRRLAPARPLMAAGLAMLFALSVVCASRGGLLTLMAGLVAAAILSRDQLRRLINLRGLLAAGGVLILVAALIITTASPQTWAGYRETSTKLRLFGWVVDMTRDNFWFGVGRGAFETAFPRYRGISIEGGNNNVTFAHAECFPLQWASEWGVPVAALVLALLVVVVGRRIWGSRRTGTSHVAIGVLVLCAQNLVDVAFEVPAVCIALCAVLASYFGNRKQQHEPEPNGLRRPLRLAVVGPLAALLSSAIALPILDLDTVTQARDSLRTLYSHTGFRHAEAAAEFDGKLRGAVLARPAESNLLVLGALAQRQIKGDPYRWLGRALELDPTRSQNYFVLGRVLMERGHLGQGLATMRYALGVEPELARVAAITAVRATRDAHVLFELVPEGPTGCTVAAAVLLHLRKTDHSNFVREAAGRGLPCDGIRLEFAELVMSSIEAGDADCRGELKNECLREVEQFVALAAKSGAEPGRRAVLRGRLIATQNGEPAALGYLSEHCSASQEYLLCARYQVQLAAKNSSENEFRKLVNAYITMACDEQPRCAPAHRFVGDLFAARSDLSDALTHLEISAKTGGGAEGWRRYAQVAHQAGARGRAEDAVKRARTDDGNTADPGSMPP